MEVEIFKKLDFEEQGMNIDGEWLTVVLWSTQRLSTFMSTQRISQHVDIIFNISTKEQWKNKMSIIM